MKGVKIAGLVLCIVFLASVSTWGAACSLRLYSNIGVPGTPEAEWWQKELAAYGDQINCKVEWVQVDWGKMYEKYLTEYAGGMAPDIVLIDGTWLASLAAQGLVLPLESYINKDAAFAWNDYFDPARNSVTSKGSIWAVPDSGDWRLFFYNSDNLANSGLQAPADSWTWDDYAAMAKKVTRPQADRPQFGSNYLPWEPVVYSYGQEIFDPVKNTFGLKNAAAIDALQWTYDFNNKSGAVPTAEQRNKQGWENAFSNQIISFYGQGAWYVRFYKMPFNWGVAMPPSGPVAKATFQNLASWFVSKSSKFPDEAWKVVRYINSQEFASKRYETFAEVPTRKSIAGKSTLALWQFYDKQKRDYVIESGAFGKLYPFSDHTLEVNAALSKGLADASLGKTSARAAVEAVTPVIEAILKK